jgi:hypothetical protein
MFANEIQHYLVVLEPFAKSHYVKEFQRLPHWPITWSGIEQQLMRFDSEALATHQGSAIAFSEDRSRMLYKMNFRIAGDGHSAKRSGNRMILLVDDAIGLIRVLLVYHKRHVRKSQETVWWQQVVQSEYGQLL